MNEQETRKRLRLTGIYRRWLTSGPALVMTILFLVFVAVFIIGRYYYRSAADNAVQNMYSNSVEQFFVSETDNSSFENAARLYVEAFEDKDIMDVWVIDPSGHVVVSSSGFSVKDQPMPDFEDALKNSTGTANFHGRNIYGESITATTHRLMKSDEPLGAVRYVVSLQQVNRQVANVFFALLIVLIAIGLIMMVSGITFIDSIVQPIRQINEVTKRIAGGDMSARMEPQEYHDEISELSENINFMADELSSTDKMKNDFISTVSHEMKTPLTAIKGWAETLQTVGDSDPTLTKRGMEVIIDEATRLTGVVEDLLDLSKIVNGRMTLRYEKIDILALLQPLVENAVIHGIAKKEQGGKITVFAEMLPPEGEEQKSTLRVFVEDTGCGISKEELPKVRKKFYKSNISVRGSGIGLAVVDEIVKMHGGTMDIQSEVGVGTCVILSFPVDTVPVEPVSVEELASMEELTEVPEVETETTEVE